MVAAWWFFPDLRRYQLATLAAVFLLRTMAEGRRAIVLTQAEVIYRPPLGRPIRTPIAGIQSIRRTRVTVSYGLQPSRVPGVVMNLVNGEVVALPLDFKKQDDLLLRLSAVTGKAIEE
jgi:hypothetical protein